MDVATRARSCTGRMTSEEGDCVCSVHSFRSRETSLRRNTRPAESLHRFLELKTISAVQPAVAVYAASYPSEELFYVAMDSAPLGVLDVP